MGADAAVACARAALSPRVCVVTVTYGDRTTLLAQAARSLAGNAHVTHWVVVTNGVAPEVVARVAQLDARITILCNATNTGSALAYAQGMVAALDTEPAVDFLWLLDDDNCPAPDTLDRLLCAHRALCADQASAARTAVCAQRPARNGHGLAMPAPRRASSFLGFHWRDIARKLVPHRPLRATRPLPVATASAAVEISTAPYGGLLLPAPLVRQWGLPDARLVVYADDTEYTDRIVRAGARIFLVHAAVVTDLSSSWSGGRRLHHAWLDSPNAVRVFYAARNEAWFDAHRRCTQRWLYRMHRSAYLALLWLRSRRMPRRSRFALLLAAVRAGERGELGPHARFPLAQIDVP